MRLNTFKQTRTSIHAAHIQKILSLTCATIAFENYRFWTPFIGEHDNIKKWKKLHLEANPNSNIKIYKHFSVFTLVWFGLIANASVQKVALANHLHLGWNKFKKKLTKHQMVKKSTIWIRDIINVTECAYYLHRLPLTLAVN